MDKEEPIHFSKTITRVNESDISLQNDDSFVRKAGRSRCGPRCYPPAIPTTAVQPTDASSSKIQSSGFKVVTNRTTSQMTDPQHIPQLKRNRQESWKADNLTAVSPETDFESHQKEKQLQKRDVRGEPMDVDTSDKPQAKTIESPHSDDYFSTPREEKGELDDVTKFTKKKPERALSTANIDNYAELSSASLGASNDKLSSAGRSRCGPRCYPPAIPTTAVQPTDASSSKIQSSGFKVVPNRTTSQMTDPQQIPQLKRNRQESWKADNLTAVSPETDFESHQKEKQLQKRDVRGEPMDVVTSDAKMTPGQQKPQAMTIESPHSDDRIMTPREESEIEKKFQEMTIQEKPSPSNIDNHARQGSLNEETLTAVSPETDFESHQEKHLQKRDVPDESMDVDTPVLLKGNTKKPVLLTMDTHIANKHVNLDRKLSSRGAATQNVGYKGAVRNASQEYRRVSRNHASLPYRTGVQKMDTRRVEGNSSQVFRFQKIS